MLAAALAVATYAAAELYAFLSPGAIGPNGPSLPLYLILGTPVSLYAAYWAFSIRRALRVRLYRRQAFGIGFLVLALWGVLGWVIFLGPNVSTPSADLEQSFAFYFLFIALFYWIDASVLASRRSDPLLRDTLHWSRVRLVLWAGIIVTTVIPFVVLTYIVAASNSALFDQMNNGTFGNQAINFLLDGVVFNFPVVIPIAGLIYLPAISLRSKWDRSLRRHFVWFVPASLGILLIFFPIPMPQSANQLVTPLILVVMCYALYRSAKALVPLNMISAT